MSLNLFGSHVTRRLSPSTRVAAQAPRVGSHARRTSRVAYLSWPSFRVIASTKALVRTQVLINCTLPRHSLAVWHGTTALVIVMLLKTSRLGRFSVVFNVGPLFKLTSPRLNHLLLWCSSVKVPTSGGDYTCMGTFCAVIAACLSTSKICRGGV